MRYPSETHSESVPSFKNLALNFRSISKVAATTCAVLYCAVLCCAVPCCLCATVCCMPHHGLHYADFLVSLASFVIIFRFFEMKPSTLMKEEKQNSRKAKSKPYAELKTNWVCVCVCVCMCKVCGSPGPRSFKSLRGMRMIQFSSVQFRRNIYLYTIDSAIRRIPFADLLLGHAA